MKQFFSILCACLLLTALVGCGAKPADHTDEEQSSTESAVSSAQNHQEDSKDTPQGEEVAVITVEGYGEIEVLLNREAAPITVENFVKLVNDGFYDGLTFHRIISGFMIQGGDPLGNGMGGSDETITGEFASNGVENPISHTRGTISMARSQLPDSASSQFFIVHEDSLFLDGEYAGFGTVVSGMEVVDAICAETAVEDGNGTVLAENQPVISSVVMKS